MSIEDYFNCITEPNWGGAVTSNASEYLARRTKFSLFWQRLKRDLLLLLSCQFFLKREKIPENVNRLLYVYLGTPQLGDSIMDLSARVLWQARGLKVDVFTHASVASFYAGDPSFHRVITDARDLATSYDFIVLQSYGSKCLKFKLRHYLSSPFVALHGHYYGCEFNRLEFADGAWRYALGLPSVEADKVCPPVFNLSLSHATYARKKEQIVLAIGGVVAWRTYPHWAKVIRETSQRVPNLEWVLLGASNGKAIASSIIKALSETHNIVNLVDELSLDEVFQLLQTASLLVAADGGLLHVGRAAKVPVVGLFAGPIHPRMRFASAETAHVIHATTAVEEIAPERVAGAIQAYLQGSNKSLTAEYLGMEPSHDGYRQSVAMASQ